MLKSNPINDLFFENILFKKNIEKILNYSNEFKSFLQKKVNNGNTVQKGDLAEKLAKWYFEHLGFYCETHGENKTMDLDVFKKNKNDSQIKNNIYTVEVKNQKNPLTEKNIRDILSKYKTRCAIKKIEKKILYIISISGFNKNIDENFKASLYTDIVLLTYDDLILEFNKRPISIRPPELREVYSVNKPIIEKGIQSLNDENLFCVEIPTGNGKTLIAQNIFHCMHANSKLNLMILAPSLEIRKEFLKNFTTYNERIVFCTYKSFSTQYYKSRNEIINFIQRQNIGLIVLDEIHRTGAKTYFPNINCLKTLNIPILTLSATPVRDSEPYKDKNMNHVLFGEKSETNTYKRSFLEANILNLFPKINYFTAVVNSEEIIQECKNKIDKSKNTLQEKDRLLKNCVDVINEEDLSNILKRIYPKHPKKTNRIMLFIPKRNQNVDDRDHVRNFEKKIEASFYNLHKIQPRFYHFISPSKEITKDMKRDYKKGFENWKNDTKEGIAILLVKEKANEGVHPIVNTLIFAGATSSVRKFVQIMGRGLNLKNDEINIIDLPANINRIAHKTPLQDELKKANKIIKERNKTRKFIGLNELPENSIHSKQYKMEVILSKIMPPREEWDAMFEKLKIYIKENNIQPHMYLKNLTEGAIKLRNWCGTQINQKSNLSEKQLKKLESINFVWDPRKTIWLQRFKEFKKYFLKNGKIPNKKDKKNSEIRAWIINQKHFYTQGKLKHYRIEAFKQINFPLQSRLLFDDWLMLFREYIAEFGKMPPQSCKYKGYTLGQWCYTQKTAKRNKKLSSEKESKLLNAGFIFDYKEYKWRLSYQAFIAYVQSNNNLPSTRYIYKIKGEEINIYSWFVCNKKKSKMLMPWQKELFQELLEFPHHTREEKWEKKYLELKAFIEKHGVWPNQKTNKQLYIWVNHQKTKQKDGKLDKALIIKLETLGIKWTLSKRDMEGRFYKLAGLYIKYRENSKKIPPTDTIYENENLGIWIQQQRAAKKGIKGRSLSEEKEAYLNKINFVWKGR